MSKGTLYHYQKWSSGRLALKRKEMELSGQGPEDSRGPPGSRPGAVGGRTPRGPGAPGSW